MLTANLTAKMAVSIASFSPQKAHAAKADLFALLGSWEDKLLAALKPAEQEIFIDLLKKIGQSACEHDRCALCDLEKLS